MASRGSVISTVEAVMVSGRLGELVPERTGEAVGEFADGEPLLGCGDAILG